VVTVLPPFRSSWLLVVGAEAEAVEEPDRPGSGAEEHGLVTVERDRAGLYVLFSCHDSPVKPPAIMIG